ncbi:hypothetical protein [Erwinia sorbitola]|uniref:Uncharacterized protein n=1 Tax=Erwinia sorbitola TaxID=2681984 RepID=A0ABW9RHZ0_9GAMM|nr:hypothetical protein [Erwinia sorbitola]MTD28996.1 hypothetical protein [Erwinia sorbitola]
MRFKKIGLPLFVFLSFYWMVTIFLVIFLLSLSIALIFYLKNGDDLYFDFLQESIYALRKALPGGIILGSGLWIKSWLQARKDKKEPTR